MFRTIRFYLIPILYSLFFISVPFKNAVFQISSALINLFFLFQLIRARDGNFFFRHKTITGMIAVLLLSMGCSNAFGITGSDGFVDTLKLFFRFQLLMFATLYFLEQKKLSLKTLFIIILLSISFHGIDGIWQYLFKTDFFGNPILAHKIIIGAVYNQNPYAFVLSLATVASAVLLLKSPTILFRTAHKSIVFLIVVFLSSAFVMMNTGCRGAWVATTAGIIACFVLQRDLIFTKTTWMVLVPSFISLFFIYRFTPYFQVRLHQLLEGYSSYRIEIWKDCLSYFFKQPFLGYGTGAYAELERAVPFVKSPHNIFISILLETGIVGLLSYLLFFGYLLKKIWEIPRHNPCRVLFFSLFVTFLVSGQFNHTMVTSKIYLSYWYVFVAGVLGWHHISNETFQE